MPQEHIFADFSGGMNALTAVDKLDPKECLLAENVRLDETGNVQSAGAFTHQNTASYADSSSTKNVHSLYWNPSLGAVAGVGKDVFAGATLGGMVNTLTGSNTGSKKMSFGSAYGRVYFDVGNVGYWTDLQNLLTVDWPPPVAVGATITGPTTVGTGTQASGVGPTWTTPNNVTSTNSNIVATTTFTQAGNFTSRPIAATMGTNSFSIGAAAVTGVSVSITEQSSLVGAGAGAQGNLIVGGVPVGNGRSFSGPGFGVGGSGFATGTAGGSNDLWGLASLTQAQVNAGNFGFQIQANYSGASAPSVVSIFNLQITIYQGTGFSAAVSTIAASMTGTYQWKVTFVDSQGEESDASSDSNSVVLAGSAGTLTALQTGDARTTARNIYRKGGALTSHYLVGTLNDNASTTYLDQQTDSAALSAGVILAGDVPGDYANTRFNNALMGAVNAPQGMGRFPTLHYDRIFWINPNKTNQIFWSKPLNGFAYPSVNFLNVGDSKPVSRIVSIFGELIIIKTDSIWRLTGTDETSFDLTPTPSAVGTDEPFTVVALPDKILFSNRWGKWVFNGYTSQPFTTKLDLWFKQEDRTGTSLFGVNGFHPPEVASTTVPLNFESVGNSEKEYFAYAEAGQTSNNALVVSDLKHGNLTKRQLGTPLPLSVAIDPVTGFVYVGDNQGFVSLLDDWNGANQGGSPGNFDFQTAYFDLQRGSNKSLWALEFYVNTNGESLTPTVYYDNGANSEALAAISASGLQRIVRTMESTNSRKMQNFSVRLNGSLNPINVAGTPQVQLVHIKALFDIRTGRARTGQ